MKSQSGRTSSSKIVLDDIGLSRLNTTFFRDGDAVFVVDENSLERNFCQRRKNFKSAADEFSTAMK